MNTLALRPGSAVTRPHNGLVLAALALWLGWSLPVERYLSPADGIGYALGGLVFGIALYDKAGTWVLGTNTDLEGLTPVRFDAPAVLRIRFDSLDLVGGEYEIDVAAHAKDGTPYDYIRVAATFHVTAASAARRT